ncbi:MotA/TolQ/ExbB proton channel family protein [Novosphingobium sp. KACC 22771]|uniref:MotA/TolQ/ExbB proton channel family protein n=1 Tax=Novosphingobium sp. KACC 22771 TaxID=3025670 RepID=UPI002366345E|nr:MotA/TolQ/ExbB proton channel family protein [Novosphingobium sp. KACC 22771]WDF70931.1 MotA/TolQ/ExbB proton channel family protein [Novosphingobium sp. KACC 22771]
MIELTPLGLFAVAGPVGKAVLVLLALVSAYAWVLIAEGVFVTRRLARAVEQAEQGAEPALLASMTKAGGGEASSHLAGETTGEVRLRIEDAMLRAARRIVEEAESGLTGLAITASAAPFVGLFGTVWGIIGSFAGIAHAGDTSLATVAPGIAEALAATAFGLAAAIPAMVGYNRLGRH